MKIAKIYIKFSVECYSRVKTRTDKLSCLKTILLLKITHYRKTFLWQRVKNKVELKSELKVKVV